ncbi:MAG: GntR family transcriptional regulator, partial [Actinobacteria bacterium]|nr:GntR family transcriptional regulator [Actinomycetota bacterium]
MPARSRRPAKRRTETFTARSVTTAARVASGQVTCYSWPMSTTAARSNLNDQVYDTLKRRLIRRELRPGEKVSLHELAGELGVSRSLVHHALTRLVSEGLLSVKSRRGYFVTPLTAAAVVEGYGVRLALELHAAEAAVGRAGAGELR